MQSLTLKGYEYVPVATCNAPLFILFFILCLTVWGVEPDVTHQTSWLGSTGECGVPQNQVGEHFAQRRALCPAVGSLGQTEKSVVPC